jgi:CheY-like chemotaxis protein
MKKILIIEDDPLIAKVYGTKYASAGFETSTASDGEEGLERLATFKPDLVHLDLSIPKVDGAEIIRRIRSRPETRSMPIIVLSNTYQNRLVKAALDAGASECVSKATCTPKMMVEIVERVFSRMSAKAKAAEIPAGAHAPVALPAPPAVPAPPASSVATATPKAPPALPTPPAPPPSPAAPSPALTETEKHAAFHAEIRSDFLKRLPVMFAALKDRVGPLLKAETEPARLLALSGLFRASHSLAGQAGMVGFQDLSMMSSALAALLRELLEKPNEVTPSSLRTVVDACDFLSVLSEHPTESAPEAREPAMVLVVDDDSLCRRAVSLALNRLHAATLSVDDPLVALRLLGENRFSLIFLDVEMPGMNGFDLCQAVRSEGANQKTPVVFVTSLSDFESRERSAASGGNDLIAKPFLPMELAVKALSLLR